MCSHYIYFLYVVYMFSIHMFIYIFHIYLRSFTVHSLLFYSRIYYFLRFCFSIWKLDTLAFSCSDFIYIYIQYMYFSLELVKQQVLIHCIDILSIQTHWAASAPILITLVRADWFTLSQYRTLINLSTGIWA